VSKGPVTKARFSKPKECGVSHVYGSFKIMVPFAANLHAGDAAQDQIQVGFEITPPLSPLSDPFNDAFSTATQKENS